MALAKPIKLSKWVATDPQNGFAATRPAQLGFPDNGLSLHTVWAQKTAPDRVSPVLDALLHIVKTRFRVITVMVLMVRDGTVVINMGAGADPAQLDGSMAVTLCRGQPDELFVVEDATPQGGHAAGSKLVRFYAGAPLVISTRGKATGMLCLIDTKPQSFSRAERMLFTSIANAVSALLLMPHSPEAAQAIALQAQKSALLLDQTQMVEAVNPRFSALAGFGAADLVKTGVDDLLCLNRPSSGAVQISHALLAEIPVRALTRCHSKLGGTFPVEVFAFPMQDASARVVKTLLLLAPVFSGPLEDFLLSLQANERDELLSLHIAGLWSVDNAGRIVKLSGAPVAHLDAAAREALAGQRFDTSGVFDATQTLWQGFYQSIAKYSLPDDVECCVTHNGHSQWFCMVGFKQFDASGRVIGYHGSFRDITLRKIKENALIKLTERHDLISKGANDGGWDWEVETGEYYLSPRWWDMLGYEPKSFAPVADIWTQFIHPDDRQGVRAALDAAVAHGHDSYQAEFRMLHKRGHYFPVLGRGHILRNKLGKVIRVSGTNQDLTAQRQSQSQIRLLQSCVESIQDVVLITHAAPSCSPGPIIVYVNPAFETFTGYTAQEAIGKTPRILQGALTCRKTLDELSLAMSSWQSFRGELVNYKKNGELFWAELEIVPIKADGGKSFSHWIGIQRDITERKRAEQVLVTTTQRLSMALEASELGLWVNYLDRREAYRDAGWHKMLGYPPSEALTGSTEWHKLLHPDDAAKSEREEYASVHHGDGAFQREFRMRHAQGHWVWIQSRGKVIEADAAGKPLVLAGTHRDVTARMEVRLQTQRMTAQLTRCLELINVGVVVQRNGVIKFNNSAILRMFGMGSDESSVGTKFSDYILPGDVEAAVWRQQQLMAGATLPSFWFNCVRRDGQVFKALTNSAIIEWGGEQHILSTLTPPGDAALLQEEVEKTRRHYEDLLAHQVQKEQVHIAHELHDSLGSQLAGISLQVSNLKLLAKAGKPLDEAIDTALSNIKTASEITRNLARGLAPVDDWPGALANALRKLCHDFSSAQGLQCHFEVEGDFDAVGGPAANHLYRITQEAVTNAVRHGAAQNISVRLVRSNQGMSLTIHDDGKGFEVRSVLSEPRTGLGLSSMYARAHAIGAQVALEQFSPRGFSVAVSWT